jgi:hypothetical protein
VAAEAAARAVDGLSAVKTKFYRLVGRDNQVLFDKKIVI